MASENTTILMYGTATQDNSASIDIPDDGVLLASSMTMRCAANADGEGAEASLEFGSTNARSTNDARMILNYVSAMMGLLTSGAMDNVARSLMLYGDGIKVFGGERLYLHSGAIGAGTFTNCRCLLLFNFKSFVARRR